MFQRKKQELPTFGGAGASNNNGGFMPMARPGSSDGSGRAIKMDAPIVAGWKRANGFTKGSYYFLSFFLLLIFIGIRSLRYWSGMSSSSNSLKILFIFALQPLTTCSFLIIIVASIWINCHAQECTLELTPPGKRTTTLVFARGQLASAHPVKVDAAGNFLRFDDSKYVPSHKGRGKKSKSSNSYKGPDESGEYRSYAIKFKTSSGEDKHNKPEDEDYVPDADFAPVMQWLSPGEEEGTYMMYMRKFGIEQSRTRVRSMVNKVESYVKRRRQKLILKENATISVKGVLCLVFGLLGIMLTILIGQFWNEPARRHGGPGVRRTSAPQPNRVSDNPKFFLDTGRPSKYPPGYQSKRY
jgi:hypothetical protein